MDSKLARLRQIISELDRPLVAFSGGVDSTVLMELTHKSLGDQAAGVILISPTLPPHELQEARELGREKKWQLIEIESQEMSLSAFTANTKDRCYHCKDHRFQLIRNYAEQNGYTHVLDGSNADDLKDYRPGQLAARQQGIRSPLQEAGFTKADIRDLARKLELPNAEKPSSACLATRIPYGTPLTSDLLSKLGRAEERLGAIGFRQLRVRHHGNIVRIEVLPDDFHQVLEARDKILQILQEAGYDYITLDLEGFRSGSMNKGIIDHG